MSEDSTRQARARLCLDKLQTRYFASKLYASFIAASLASLPTCTDLEASHADRRRPRMHARAKVCCEVSIDVRVGGEQTSVQLAIYVISRYMFGRQITSLTLDELIGGAHVPSCCFFLVNWWKGR